MSIIKQKVLKNSSSKLLIAIFILILLLLIFFNAIFIYSRAGVSNKKLKKVKFYYLNFYGKIESERQFIPINSSLKEFLEFYFYGSYNRKKFPLFFLSSFYIDDISYHDFNLYISLNEKGYEVFKKLGEQRLKKICNAILITLNKNGYRGFKKVIIIYKQRVEIYNYQSLDFN